MWIHKRRDDVRDVVDPGIATIEVVGVDVGPSEAGRPADVRRDDVSAPGEQQGIEVAVAGAALALRAPVEVDDRRCRAGGVRRGLPPRLQVQTVPGREGHRRRHDGVGVGRNLVHGGPGRATAGEEVHAPRGAGPFDGEAEDGSGGVDRQLGRELRAFLQLAPPDGERLVAGIGVDEDPEPAVPVDRFGDEPVQVVSTWSRWLRSVRW